MRGKDWKEVRKEVRKVLGEEGAQAVRCSWIHYVTDPSQEHLTEVALDKYRPIGLPKPRGLVQTSEIYSDGPSGFPIYIHKT